MNEVARTHDGKRRWLRKKDYVPERGKLGEPLVQDPPKKEPKEKAKQ